jgi:ubiquinone/menaquinone biosynthesis C-methylase UbiE
MNTFRQHAMLPTLEHDERARQAFVKSFRGHLASKVMPGNYKLYEARVEPRFRAETGRSPADQHEIRKAMEQDPYYQFWSAMQRRSQELMWESVIEPTERQVDDLIARSRKLATGKVRGRAKGTLRLNPDLRIPRYHTAADIHLQPGGYHTDFTADDVTAGVVYDNAIYLYLNGALGPENNSMGDLLVGFYREQFPGAKPQRILDMGCAIGNSTLQWGRAFPRAELHGIDVGAPVLRYAHARAESLGVTAHFSQQNAEGTDFEPGSFDLVISHIMLHETSKSAIVNIMRECRRLLKPGGVMLHLEIPRGKTAVEKFMFNWESYNNNETFAQYMTDLDLKAVAVKGGFDPDRTEAIEYAPRMSSEQMNYSEEFLWKILVGRA